MVDHGDIMPSRHSKQGNWLTAGASSVKTMLFPPYFHSFYYVEQCFQIVAY